MNVVKLLKSNAGFLVSLLIIGLVAFNPNLKALVLRGLLKTGLFAAKTSAHSETTQPDIALVKFMRPDGTLISFADLKGKVIFLNFWATWCPPCIAEMPSINTLYNNFRHHKNVVFIMADADNDFNKSNTFMRKNGYDLPLWAPASPVPDELFSGNLPTTIIIDPQGKIVFRHEGLADYGSEQMLQFLNTLSQHQKH